MARTSWVSRLPKRDKSADTVALEQIQGPENDSGLHPLAVAGAVGLLGVILLLAAAGPLNGEPKLDYGVAVTEAAGPADGSPEKGEPPVADETDDQTAEKIHRPDVVLAIGECLTAVDGTWDTTDCAAPHSLEMLIALPTPIDGPASTIIDWGEPAEKVMEAVDAAADGVFAIAKPGEEATFDGRHILVDCWETTADPDLSVCAVSDLGTVSAGTRIDYQTTTGRIGQ